LKGHEQRLYTIGRFGLLLAASVEDVGTSATMLGVRASGALVNPRKFGISA
jgi:hypothetical protein